MNENNVIAAILTTALWNARTKQHFEDWREVINDYYRIRKQLAADEAEPSPAIPPDEKTIQRLAKELNVNPDDFPR